MHPLISTLFLLTVILAPLGAQEAPRNPSPAALQESGNEHFFAGHFQKAIADYDTYLAAFPQRAPYHWQRGLALYYAKEYDEGVAQFESHQKVNRHDVENAVWHFICVVRGKDGSVEKAREKFIPIVGDTRVPLKEVHALYAGKGTAEAVLTAANANAEGLNLRNQLCYAHLYLGLYYEALGDDKKSAEHIELAAVDYKMDHYMGKTAQVHHKLRK
jgi:lipoprotein NlpI